MSEMEFREPNEVLWRGVRPAHKGTQVAKEATANNATETLHTVTAGKTLYLTHWVHTVRSNITGLGMLFVTDDLDVARYYISQIRSQADVAAYAPVGSLYIPIEIPEGYKIKVSSSAAGCVIFAFIHGWEE